MICIRYRLVFYLVTFCLIGQHSAAPVIEDSTADYGTAPVSPLNPVDESTSSPSDLIMIDSTSQTKVKSSNRLAETINNMRDRVEKSRQVLTGIVDSFVSNPGDGSKLEEALAQYDEVVEDIEADFTKAKLEFGLRMEQNVDKANETLDQMEKQLHDLNTQFINWSTINRARMTKQLRQGLLQFNDFLSSGVEMLLEASEKGKDVIRNLQRRRFDSKQSPFQSTEDSPKRSGLFIPFLGQL